MRILALYVATGFMVGVLTVAILCLVGLASLG